MKSYDQLALEFFLLCLTDERVRLEQAPFDHPSLRLTHGYNQQLQERVMSIPAIGRRGWTRPDGRPDPDKIPSRFPDQLRDPN